MPTLDPRSATDWLVLYAVTAGEESMSERMEAVIEHNLQRHRINPPPNDFGGGFCVVPVWEGAGIRAAFLLQQAGHDAGYYYGDHGGHSAYDEAGMTLLMRNSFSSSLSATALQISTEMR